jgi:hypothetical protein
MTEIPPNNLPPAAAGIVQRAKDIIVKPKETWAAIAAEPATTQSIYVPYVVALAAIGPIAQFVGGQAFGYSAFGVTYHPPIASALVGAVVSYGWTLATVFILALVIDGLAPSFGGEKNQTQALKVAAYSATASWLAGIFGLVPALAILGIVGLYSLYLLYLGLPIVMKAPQDKALGYTAIVIIVAIALFLIAGVIIGALTAPSLLTVRG